MDSFCKSPNMERNIFFGRSMFETSHQVGSQSHHDHSDAKKHTLNPVTTGSSVLGIKFEDGVILVADVLGAYGSLARYQKFSRMFRLSSGTVIAASGDLADFQYLQQIIEQKDITEQLPSDSFKLGSRAIFTWLSRVLYQARSRFNPYWNIFIVGGIEKGKPFLGYVDKLGVSYEEDTVTTGIGHYLARPMMREAYEKNPKMTREEAEKVLIDAMKVLYYRETKSFAQYQVAIITADKTEISDVKKLDTDWKIAEMVVGYM